MSTHAPFMPGQTDAPAAPGNLRLNLSGGGLCWRLPFCRAELHRALSAMLRAAGSGPAELDLILVRDAGMAGYNLRYMGCHGPTNVLSFPIDEQIAGPGGRRRPRPARKSRLFRRHPAPGNAPVRARAQGTLPQASRPRARASGRLRPRPGNGRIVFRNALSGTGLAECPMKSKRGTTACHFHNAVIDALQYGSASDVPPHIRLLSAGSALGSVEW